MRFALRLKRLGIDTYTEPVLYLRADSPACRAEGFEARSRVTVALNGRAIVATLNVVSGALLAADEAGLSESAWRALDAREGDHVSLAHPAPVSSDSRLRAKVYGEALSEADMHAIVADVVAGRYSDLHLAAFVTASAGDRLNAIETLGLTRAMIETGEQLRWSHPLVADKHSIGGLPGNRTTPIVVAIVAACGLPIPKTSSRAITSPAGTADAMETLAPVALDIAAMRRVVEREGGCVVWGGSMGLAPADDLLIRVERPLDFDSDGQMVASILSKKSAAGATHVVIDMPVGPTAKVRTEAAMRSLGASLHSVAAAIGLCLRVVPTDGRQPIGRGIGPALEARDVLAVLQNAPGAPADLRRRALMLSAELLDFSGGFTPATAQAAAAAALDEGRAWQKFQAICEAQGGMRVPPASAHRHAVAAQGAGTVTGFDNRRLARIAKLAGAPRAPAAGIDLHARIGERIAAGQPLYTVHAETAGELQYALDYLAAQRGIVTLGDGA